MSQDRWTVLRLTAHFLVWPWICSMTPTALHPVQVYIWSRHRDPRANLLELWTKLQSWCVSTPGAFLLNALAKLWVRPWKTPLQCLHYLLFPDGLPLLRHFGQYAAGFDYWAAGHLNGVRPVSLTSTVLFSTVTTVIEKTKGLRRWSRCLVIYEKIHGNKSLRISH